MNTLFKKAFAHMKHNCDPALKRACVFRSHQVHAFICRTAHTHTHKRSWGVLIIIFAGVRVRQRFELYAHAHVPHGGTDAARAFATIRARNALTHEDESQAEQPHRTQREHHIIW